MNYLKNALICLLGLISISAKAQNEMQTLFGKSKNKIQSLGFYIAPELTYGQFSSSFVPIVGNSVMLTLNKKFAIGATASSTIRDNNTKRGHFGGLKMEYTPNPDAVVHISFPFVVGAGNISSRENYKGFDRGVKYDDRFEFRRNGSFVIQPGVNAAANLFKYAQVFLGASYRLSANKSGYYADLSGFSSSLGLKFGLFDYKIKNKNIETLRPVEEVK